ncbi:MAG: hypothetical protein B6229_04915 [Spirochaetaceae bacterium 4572_7]|nr:MAG: hypothetical protein B6229_04915 [Spirochaetaceae bacterium 4572_7]
MNYVEIIGYVASILVAISLTMSQILKLRVINFVGAVTFAIYGYFLGAYPILIVNTFIACINIYYLIKMYKTKDQFDQFEVTGDSTYLNRFFLHYKDDIQLFFTDFKYENFEENKIIFILRNMRPVNLIVYNEQDNGITEILLDYTIAEYRDFLNGKYLVSMFKSMVAEGDNRQLVSKATNGAHEKYLYRLGFSKNDNGLFVKKI